MKKHPSKKIRKRRPFTVLEMLVSMALLSIIVYSLSLLMNQSQKAMNLGVSKMDAFEELSMALDQMEDSLNNIDVKSWRTSKDAGEKVGDKELQSSALICGNDSFTVYVTRQKEQGPELHEIRYSLVKIEDEHGETLSPGLKNLNVFERKVGGDPGSPDDDNNEGDTILTNVKDFKVMTPGGTFEAKRTDLNGNTITEEYPRMVVLELAVLDSNTANLGKDMGKPEDINLTRIKKALGDSGSNEKTLEHRLKRLVRAVTLDVSALQ